MTAVANAEVRVTDLTPRPITCWEFRRAATGVQVCPFRRDYRRRIPAAAAAWLLAVLASLALAGRASSAPVQWPVSEGGNGHFYEHVNPQRTPSITWTEARDDAAAHTFMGVAGHLATVTSEAERTYLFNQFSVRPSSSQVWIGGVQAPGVTTPTAGWSWVTGEPWDYTAWVAGEPNDWFANERYLSMLTYLQAGSVAGAWNDNDIRGIASAYLVEYAVAPEPGSAAALAVAAGMMLTRRAGGARPRRAQRQ